MPSPDPREALTTADEFPLSKAASAAPPRRHVAAWLGTPAGAVLLLILGTGLFRIALAFALGLGIDESYMVASGRHVELGYFDHPPLSWWMAWGAAQLAGSEAPIVVRLPFIIAFAVSTWLMFRLGALLYTPRAGFWSAATLNLAPVLGFTTGSWVLPDGPLICALLGGALCLTHAVSAEGRSAMLWWLGAGICAGLALLAKYTALLSLLGAFVFLLTQQNQRRWLLRPEPYAAAGIAAILFSPVLVWNARHHWASFLFQGSRAFIGSFHPWAPLATLGGEALFLLPWLWLALMVLFIGGLRRGRSDERSWLLCCLAAGPILFFAVISAWSQKRVLFHWAAPGYVMLFPLLGAALPRWLDENRRLVRLGLAATAGLVSLSLLLVASEVRLNWMPGLVEHFAPGDDPALEAVDWTSLRTALAERGLLSRPGLVVGATRWLEAGKLDYALGGEIGVICLCADARQYGRAGWPADHIGEDVVIMGRHLSAAQVQESLGNRFDTIEPLAPAMLEHAGRPVESMPMFLGHHLRDWPLPRP